MRVARRLGIHVATMTGVLARLEKAGRIVRRRDVVDRRSVQVKSTGFERLTGIYRDGDERVDAIAAQLSAERAPHSELPAPGVRGDPCGVGRIAVGEPTS